MKTLYTRLTMRRSGGKSLIEYTRLRMFTTSMFATRNWDLYDKEWKKNIILNSLCRASIVLPKKQSTVNVKFFCFKIYFQKTKEKANQIPFTLIIKCDSCRTSLQIPDRSPWFQYYLLLDFAFGKKDIVVLVTARIKRIQLLLKSYFLEIRKYFNLWWEKLSTTIQYCTVLNPGVCRSQPTQTSESQVFAHLFPILYSVIPYW